LAALEAHDPGLRLAEDAANEHRRHKAREAIRVPKVSPQS
jgi:hypothetical protein